MYVCDAKIVGVVQNGTGGIVKNPEDSRLGDRESGVFLSFLSFPFERSRDPKLRLAA